MSWSRDILFFKNCKLCLDMDMVVTFYSNVLNSNLAEVTSFYSLRLLEKKTNKLKRGRT